jgi:hypothetical protein
MKIVDAAPADVLTPLQRVRYDAAVRLQGISAAARELGLNPGSVSAAVSAAVAAGLPDVPRRSTSVPRQGRPRRPQPTAASPATSATEEAMPGVRLPGGRVEGGPRELASSPPTEPPERRAAADHEREGFAPAPWTRPPARTVESIRSARTPRQYLGLDAKVAEAPVAEAVRAPFGTAINAVDDEPATDEGTPLEQPATDPVSAEPALPPSAPTEPVASTPAPIVLEVRARDVVSRRLSPPSSTGSTSPCSSRPSRRPSSPRPSTRSSSRCTASGSSSRGATEARIVNLIEDHVVLDWHEANALVLALTPLIARSRDALRLVDAIVEDGLLP